MIDFTTLQGLTIPEGVVTQITDASSRVLWALNVGGPVILEVEKITSNTYAGETTYTGEQFILLDIYPKTNGTVNVTYGSLTKTITDTSGAEEPNAQQVFFGTFNGVSDSVATPASGELTIDGDCVAFACSSYSKSSKDAITPYCHCIKGIINFGSTSKIPDNAYSSGTAQCPLTSVIIPANVKHIGASSFSSCPLENAVIENGVESIGDRAFMATNLTELLIPESVRSIGSNPFQIGGNNIITVDNRNGFYKVDGNCLIEIATNKVVSGFANSNIPSYVTDIGSYAFTTQTSYTSITIPKQITNIGDSAYWISGLENVTVLATIPPTIGENMFVTSSEYDLIITVPSGCGDIYKTAEGWSDYADYIVEAS